MQIGKLRRRIAIQVRAAAQSSTGQPSGTWSTFATVWASIEPLSGRELLAAQAAQSEVTHQVTIRYLAGVKPAMRIAYGGRYFNIRAVRNLSERGRVMVLDCTEGQDTGGIG